MNDTESAIKNNVESISSLLLYLQPVRHILDDDQVTEVCINKPNEVFVQRYSGWSQETAAFATPSWCRNMASLVANRTRQGIGEATPLLSADLPSGERIQFVLPPAAEHVSITIRRPSTHVWTLGELAVKGLFDRCQEASQALDDVEQRLLTLKNERNYLEFLKLAVRSKKNILVSGVTGSGKTTATKALMLEVPSQGCAGIDSEQPSESCPLIIFQRFPRACPGYAQAITGSLFTHEAGSHLFGRVTRG